MGRKAKKMRPLSLRSAWWEAALEGDDERMKELSAEPDFITAVNGALHLACLAGLDKAVALLLAVHPKLIETKARYGWTPLHCAASKGYDKIVKQLLAAGPHLIHAVTKQTALHLAASNGHAKAVTLLLTTSSELITQVDGRGWTALHCAVGHETVFSQLLGYCPPSVIDARTSDGATVLHLATQGGHSDTVARILDVRPEFITAVDKEGCNPVHHAVRKENQILAERMLAIKPEAICAVSKYGNTVLHQALRARVAKQFIAKLWRMNPQALHAVNKNSQTPFDLAVRKQRHGLVRLFRPSVCFDEFISAFAHENDFQKRYRPAVKRRCESLWDFLNQDVASIVFEYLGFAQKMRPRKRAKRSRDIPSSSLRQRKCC